MERFQVGGSNRWKPAKIKNATPRYFTDNAAFSESRIQKSQADPCIIAFVCGFPHDPHSNAGATGQRVPEQGRKRELGLTYQIHTR